MVDNETKVVKAKNTTKRKKKEPAGSSQVEIRPVDISVIEAQQARRSRSTAPQRERAAESEKRAGSAQSSRQAPRSGMPPVGANFQFGKPMPKKAVPQNLDDTPAASKDEPEKTIPAEAPKVESKTDTAVETKLETPVEPKQEPKLDAPVDTKPEPKPAASVVEDKKKEPELYIDKSLDIGVKIIKKTQPEAAPSAKVEEVSAKPEAEAKTSGKEEPRAKAKPADKRPEARKPAAKTSSEAAKDATAEKQAPAKPQADKKPAQPKKRDFFPNIGVKIVKTAEQVEQEQEQRRAKRAAAEKKKPERKPKEYKKDADQASEETAPRRMSYKGKKTSEGGREKVVAYTAPSGKSSSRRRGKTDRRKKSYEDAVVPNLTKATRKKHSQYRDNRPEEVVQSAAEIEAAATGGTLIDVPITVGGFCEQLDVSAADAIMTLMKMGIMANINQNLDEETAVLLGMELGKVVVVNKVEELPDLEEILDLREDSEDELKDRPPVITVMGHVDHGKTSLLDAIRSTNVTKAEAGGITQHIGASEIEINDQKIVFLDTPGHEAFTAMRARGAHVTDIAVLVVAADDSVKPQTIESITHAKAAGVPIIVAINKIDKPAANIDRVKKDLAENNVLVEDWGGETITVPVSAKTGEGIKDLLEMILIQAEMLELKANPDRLATGTVIEARLDKSRGPIATLLVTNGTLQVSQAIVVGTVSGRIRVMVDWKGNRIRKAGPSRAVEITGLTDVPQAGDEFYVVEDERLAREIAAKRQERLREQTLARSAGTSLEELFANLQEGEMKDLNLIIKADVQGSVGALQASLEKLRNENVRVQIIHSSVGTVSESDVMLATTSGAIIIGFNVRPNSAVQAMADREGVEIRTYRVIYEVIEEIEAAMKGMLAPKFKEVILGKAQVRETFKVPGAGTIAGAYVMEGKILRNAQIRLLRDGIVVHEGTISSLKRFKDDAREVNTGFECGIGIEKYNDIKEGDVIEAFEMQEVER